MSYRSSVNLSPKVIPARALCHTSRHATDANTWNICVQSERYASYQRRSRAVSNSTGPSVPRSSNKTHIQIGADGRNAPKLRNDAATGASAQRIAPTA